jgi:1-deoxy-D-xylulose-5-phosphate reductoisomerase
MIRLKDGGVYASLSPPDMRIPIRQALYWPEVKGPCFTPLDFESPGFNSLTLEFYKPDMEQVPMLALAYNALRKGGFYPCVYNSANEAAVASFLSGRIGFLDIPRIVGSVLDMDWKGLPCDIAEVLDIDKRAREIAIGYTNSQYFIF